uniref:Uncharacterized protein n=1 Tax=Tanacetum cinerariifolium TaxID=118510 RepID=A0A6L2MKT7_TANCI|nr:hypothetical protein [Tanacetum cinerariifolium]
MKPSLCATEGGDSCFVGDFGVEDSVIGAHKSHVIDGPEDPPPKHLEKKRSGKTKPAVVYNYGYKRWRFVLEGLPADLIRRGMAVPGLSQRSFCGCFQAITNICGHARIHLGCSGSHCRVVKSNDVPSRLQPKRPKIMPTFSPLGSDSDGYAYPVFVDLLDRMGMDIAKITKKWPKADKNEHEIVKSAQKPDPKTCLCTKENHKTLAKVNTTRRAIPAIYQSFKVSL